MNYYSLSQREYKILLSQVLKTEGGLMESRGCATHSIELVQTWPSLIFKFKQMATCLLEFGPTQWWVWHTPYFSSSGPGFEVLGVLSFGGDYIYRLYLCATVQMT